MNGKGVMSWDCESQVAVTALQRKPELQSDLEGVGLSSIASPSFVGQA